MEEPPVHPTQTASRHSSHQQLHDVSPPDWPSGRRLLHLGHDAASLSRRTRLLHLRHPPRPPLSVSSGDDSASSIAENLAL